MAMRLWLTPGVPAMVEPNGPSRERARAPGVGPADGWRGRGGDGEWRESARAREASTMLSSLPRWSWLSAWILRRVIRAREWLTERGRGRKGGGRGEKTQGGERRREVRHLVDSCA